MSTFRHPNSLNEADIWQMLLYIPAHDRDTWVKVGMALNAELGDGGYFLFDEWSKSADNYDERAVKSVWRSFNGDAVRMGTLVHFAREHGWSKSQINHPRLPEPKAPPSVRKTSTQSYALRLWLAADTNDKSVADHVYSVTKGIDWAAGSARGNTSGLIVGKNADCIIIPIRNIKTDKVQGVQCINPDGKKQTFGRVSDGALILGNSLDKSIPWYVAEGWASAASMVFHHHQGNAVCAASFGKSNLDKVAKLIAQVYEPDEVVILRERD